MANKMTMADYGAMVPLQAEMTNWGWWHHYVIPATVPDPTNVDVAALRAGLVKMLPKVWKYCTAEVTAVDTNAIFVRFYVSSGD